MQVLEFRITNFRSIIDTNWRKFSPDNVTVLIGQNESGKTSLLEALAKTFGNQDISEDDIRIDEPLPAVRFKISLTNEDIDLLTEYFYDEKHHEPQIIALKKYLLKNKEPFEIMFEWQLNDDRSYKKWIVFSDNKTEVIEEILEETLPKEVAVPEQDPNPEEATITNDTDQPNAQLKPTAIISPAEEKYELTIESIIDALDEISPTISFFEHESGLLPSKIDIIKHKTGKNILTGSGSNAARNFLTVAGLNLEKLISADVRSRASLLTKANAKITADFSDFWSQTIGRTDKLKLECEVQAYGTEAGDKAGKSYLQFWVNDGLNKLYPKQRSQGVRWFVSFYLQLKASELKSTKRLFLLDEPGANLHSKAQSDVIKLINDLSKDILIVYSTHIPHMLEYDKLYRVLAVQRMGEKDDSPTEIKPAHELGTASTDTLSPVLTAMGADFANQQVIKKRYNVLLEEMSAFYYLKAFWELTNEKQEAHFIAATGVNKIPNFANMFLGWGLEYIIVVDDDKSGRNVYNCLKTDIFGDDEVLAKKNMLKIKGCDGIEDIISKNDFKALVINDSDASISTTNSEYMKRKKLSKPVHAYSFFLKVHNGDITFENFDNESQNNIKNLANEIKSRL